MLLSFFKRALAPQAVFLAVLPLLHLLLPVRREQFPVEDFGIAVARSVVFLAAAAVAWLLSLVLTGWFLPSDTPRASPSPPPPPAEKKEELSLGFVLLLWLIATAVLVLLPAALAWASLVLYWLWLLQFGAFLLCCIPLFNVFRTKMGPAVLEALERRKQQRAERDARAAKERKLRERRDRIAQQIQDAEREAERLRASPLEADVVEDSILQLQAKARDLKQELAVLDSAGDEA
jgi:hypothetical protein